MKPRPPRHHPRCRSASLSLRTRRSPQRDHHDARRDEDVRLGGETRRHRTIVRNDERHHIDIADEHDPTARQAASADPPAGAGAEIRYGLVASMLPCYAYHQRTSPHRRRTYVLVRATTRRPRFLRTRFRQSRFRAPFHFARPLRAHLSVRRQPSAASGRRSRRTPPATSASRSTVHAAPITRQMGPGPSRS